MFEDFDQFRRPDWFRITLDGIQAGDFREVKGLEIQVPIEEYAEGGLNDHAHKLPGQARFSTILLRRGSSDSLELFDWIESAMRGDLEFRSGSIMALNARSEPVLIWEFRKAWPCRYEGSSFDRAKPELHIETLELGHHGFSLRRGTGGALTGPRPAAAAKSPNLVTEPGLQNLDPNSMRFSQRSAGGSQKGPPRAQALRASMGENGWDGPPVDAVATADGVVTIDNTRVAVAQELGIESIPVQVHAADEPLPDEMIAEERFGPDATTWGDAAAQRAGKQDPPLGPTGTAEPPRLPEDWTPEQQQRYEARQARKNNKEPPG